MAIFANVQVDRSPCGTLTAALMAVVDAMGLLSHDCPFSSESIIGTSFSGSVVDWTTVGELPAIIPRIKRSAWITGEHKFLIDDADLLREGFNL